MTNATDRAPAKEPVLSRIDAVVDAILAGILAATTLILIAGVFFRYVLNDSLAWTDEIGGNMLGWISFLGAYSCFRKRLHLDFDMVLHHLSPKTRRWVQFASYLLVLIFVLAMAWMSWVVVDRVGGSYISSVDIPRGVFLAVLPVSFALMALAIARILLNLLKGRGDY
jgi:TRAP-type C4-dicarboxylate transport system permease small subunit